MNALKLCKTTSYHSSLLSKYSSDAQIKNLNKYASVRTSTRTHDFVLRASVDGQEDKPSSERRSFLTLEEAGMVEMSGLSSHEGFLCRLTVCFIAPIRLCILVFENVQGLNYISSLNLLRVIGEQEGCSIEELNAGKVCDWFLKDKLKREQNMDPVLQWDESDFLL
ncbi:hypothetical protein Hdeb2414_s0024g00653191 [Helianthus debilis subsp. tardiflorus]